MQNADLTWSQDLGDVTELLSGKFFEPLGRSTAHQLWSSAMVISPVVRGMFGLEWDAPRNTLSVNPHLPADWQGATIRNVPFGTSRVDLKFTRVPSALVIEALHPPDGLKLISQSAGARIQGNVVRIPLPDVEVAIGHQLPEFGAATSQLKVLDQQATAHSLTLSLSGRGGATYNFLLRENAPKLKVRADGATLGASKDELHAVSIAFPSAPGYTRKTVTFSW